MNCSFPLSILFTYVFIYACKFTYVLFWNIFLLLPRIYSLLIHVEFFSGYGVRSEFDFIFSIPLEKW